MLEKQKALELRLGLNLKDKESEAVTGEHVEHPSTPVQDPPQSQSPQERYGHLTYREVELLWIDGGLDSDPEALEWFKKKMGPQIPGTIRMPKL